MWPLGGVEFHMTLLWLLVGPLLGETWAIYIKGSPTSPLANTSMGEASPTLQLIQWLTHTNTSAYTMTHSHQHFNARGLNIISNPTKVPLVNNHYLYKCPRAWEQGASPPTHSFPLVPNPSLSPLHYRALTSLPPSSLSLFYLESSVDRINMLLWSALNIQQFNNHLVVY
jgi:hypothetical protein